MKYKILILGDEEKVTISRKQFEKYLEEAYQDGYEDGKHVTSITSMWDRNPIINPPYTFTAATTSECKFIIKPTTVDDYIVKDNGTKK